MDSIFAQALVVLILQTGMANLIEKSVAPLVHDIRIAVEQPCEEQKRGLPPMPSTFEASYQFL